jgi:AraC-like DNA-binding protein
VVSRLSKLGFIDARRARDPVRRRVRSRGVPPALAEHEVFYTEDPAEGAELIGEALAPCRLTLGDVGSSGFAASLHGVRLRDVSLLHLDLHVSATLDLPRCGSYFAVHMPTNGRAVGELAGRPFESNPIRALVTSPGQPLRMRFDHDSPQLIVRVEQDAMERHLTRVLGRMMTQPLVFEPELDLTADAASRWHGAVQLLHTEVLQRGSLVQRGVGISPLEEFLMSSLLYLQPSSYHHQLARPVRQPGRRTVRRAVDYIEQHLSHPVTMDDIAAHVGASIRSIQLGFRDELGISPMAYLRDRRLERAREELTDAEPSDGVTVTSVAEHWGFHHLGSFAGLYRQRWGESPSDTLRR